MKQLRNANGQYSYKPNNIFTWRVAVLSGVVLWCAVMGSHVNDDNTYQREPEVFMKPVVVENKQETIETKIRHYFPKSWKTMIAVAHAESQMNPNAVGYNCIYNGVSKACKPEDRHKAWSLDCGLLQLNTKAKQCPNETIDEHLKRASELSRVQGLEAWVAYNTKAHTKYLK